MNMVTDDKKKRVSNAQVMQEALGSNKENLKLSADKTKSIILLIGFILVLAFFIFPFIIGLFYEYSPFSANPAISIIGMLLAGVVVYVGGIK
jgi:hypothetical protein